MAKRKRYTQYNDDVNNFGNSAFETLKARMVDVPDYVLSQLDEAVGYLQRAQDCKEQIKREGLMIQGRLGPIQHPLIKVQESCTVQFYKLITGLMITPQTQDKAKKVDHTEDNRIIDSLINS